MTQKTTKIGSCSEFLVFLRDSLLVVVISIHSFFLILFVKVADVINILQILSFALARCFFLFCFSIPLYTKDFLCPLDD